MVRYSNNKCLMGLTFFILHPVNLRRLISISTCYMFNFWVFFLAMSILTFAAVIDLTIALENDGFVHSVMAFYFVSGEPYLKSGHGSGINYHDGIIHFACYIIILLAIDNRFVKFVVLLINQLLEKSQ